MRRIFLIGAVLTVSLLVLLAVQSPVKAEASGTVIATVQIKKPVNLNSVYTNKPSLSTSILASMAFLPQALSAVVSTPNLPIKIKISLEIKNGLS